MTNSTKRKRPKFGDLSIMIGGETLPVDAQSSFTIERKFTPGAVQEPRRVRGTQKYTGTLRPAAGFDLVALSRRHPGNSLHISIGWKDGGARNAISISFATLAADGTFSALRAQQITWNSRPRRAGAP